MKALRFFELALLVVALLAACGGDAIAGAAREWLQASASADGATTLRLTCQQYREDVQMTGFLTAGLGLMVGIDTSSAKVDMRNVKFTTTSKSGDTAIVHVEGEIIVSLLGAAMPQQIDSDLQMVREGGEWKVCGSN